MMKKLDPLKNKLLICVGLVLGIHSYAQIPYSHYYTDAQEALDRKDTINAIKAYESSINEEHFELSKPMLALVYEEQKRYKEAYSLFLSYASTSEPPVWSHMRMLAGSRIKVAEYKLEGRGTEKDTLGAVKWLNEALDIDVQGKAHAMLGYCYLNAGDAIKNENKAFECYKYAAENFDNWSGKIALATCYIEGIGCKQDFSRAYSILEDSVMSKDDIRGQLLLGIAYYKDSSSDDHYQKAVELLSLVANNNWNYGEKYAAAAKYWLSKCYRFGYGVVKDANKADELVNKAYNQGSEDSFNARCLLDRDWLYLYRTEFSDKHNLIISEEKYSKKRDTILSDIKTDHKLTYSERLEKKAEKGDLWAKCDLAQCFYFGLGIPKDKEKSKLLFLDVIERGKKDKYYQIFERSYWFLCRYPNSTMEIPQNFYRLFFWNTEDAATLGDSWSQYYLGCIYLLGDRGFKKNISEAIFWLQMASEQGFCPAQFLLGTIYYDKHGLEYNLREAIKWFEKAASNHSFRAMFQLADIYFHHETVKDAEKSHFWLENAIQLLEKEIELPAEEKMPYKFKLTPKHLLNEAQILLGEMYYKGEGVKRDYNTAVNLLNNGIESNANALYILSKCYRFGRGVEKDIKKAEELEEKAAKLGNEDAKEILELTKIFQ